jgi:hypothetical protein
MAIVAPNHAMYCWRKEIRLIMPDWTVLYVEDARSLKGLARNLAELHLVVFNLNVFQTYKPILKTFFSSGLDVERPWTEDHETMWTTQWHTVVIDEVQNLVPSDDLVRRHASQSTPADTLYLDRNAVVLKALVPGNQYILMSDKPELNNAHHLDTYAYFLGITHEDRCVYPGCPTLQDHIRSKPMSGTSGGKALHSFSLAQETRTKVHHLFRQHCVVSTGVQIQLETYRDVFTYHESSQYLQFPMWRYRMTPRLSITEGTTFSEQCENYVEHIRRVHPETRVPFYTSILAAVLEDKTHASTLGTILNTDEDLNRITVHPGLSPLQTAMVRVMVWLVDIKKARVLIYTDSTRDIWKNTEPVLKDMYGINVVNHHNKKRQRSDEIREVLFIPQGHLEGISLGFVTHIFVVGKIKNEATFAEFLKRTMRLGRTSPLRILELNASPI